MSCRGHPEVVDKTHMQDEEELQAHGQAPAPMADLTLLGFTILHRYCTTSHNSAHLLHNTTQTVQSTTDLRQLFYTDITPRVRSGS